MKKANRVRVVLVLQRGSISVLRDFDEDNDDIASQLEGRLKPSDL